MALDLAFDADALSRLRKAVFDEAAGAGMPNHRAADVVIAVHELAANAVRHGAGGGLLTMRIQAGRLRCRVSDTVPERIDGNAFRTITTGPTSSSSTSTCPASTRTRSA
jgi:anti-sigma regulatory factor (Ser/Thr protein kinase)